MRLASVEPQADQWFDPRLVAARGPLVRWRCRTLEAVKAYLLDTLETTLELLEHTPDEDDALYFFRMALFHEDLRGEQLVTIAQTLGVPLRHGAARRAWRRASRCWCCRPRTGRSAGRDDRSFAFDIERGRTRPCRCPSSRSMRSR